MDTNLDKKNGFPSKLRATISNLFSACIKNAEITSSAISTTLVSDFDNQKLAKEHPENYVKSDICSDISIQVDLCFVLDCTISMGSYIAAAKDCIINVVDYMEQTNPNIKLWVGLCGYRDHCDGFNRLQIFNFTDSYSDFKAYINGVCALGGGDSPEDVLGGLDAAVKQMNWSHSVRVLLHIGDAPPHGRRFTSMHDDYPEGDPYGLTAENVLREIRSAGIHYYFGKITNKTDRMIRVFRNIIGGFMVFNLATEGNDPKTLTAKVFDSICSSITTSVTLNTMEKGHQRKLLEKDLHEPNWKTLSFKTGELLYYHPPKTLMDIKNPKHFKNKDLIIQNFSYKRAPKPFSSGTERYAYFALNVTHEPVEKIVMKAYIDNGRKANSIERYLEKLEVSAVAYFLAIEFNLVAAQFDISKEVNFLKVQLLRHTFGFFTRYYTIELRFQYAEFKRFNVNSGVIKEYHSILEAFAHFTYEYTGGYLVVYDLQGVELADQFLLTDPAIHCIDPLRFGRTNLGSKGIKECFLANHKCGSVCQKLGLSKIGRN